MKTNLAETEAEVRARIAAKHAEGARAERRRALSLLPPSEAPNRQELAELAAAEKRPDAAPAIRAIEKRVKERNEETQVFLGITEQKGLATGAGIVPEARTKGRYKPNQRLDGLDFLAHQKVITPAQYQAGRRWTAYYGLVETGDVKSCLGALEIRSQTQGLEPGQRKVFARLKLQMAKDALGKHDGMIEALNSICGEGSRPSELSTDRRANERAVNFLNCALSILAKHWGL